MTNKTWMVVVGALLTLMATDVTAQAVPADWKTDCVGRMQISLPGDVDIAAMLPKDFIKKLAEKGGSPYKFEDGQDASWSSSSFMEISHPITPEERQRINAEIETLRGKVDERFQEERDESGRPLHLAELSSGTFDGKAWRGDRFFSAYLHVGPVSVGWNFASQLVKDAPNVAKNYQTLLTGLRPRPTFDVPKDPGVCLPYLFVKDDGKEPRHVGMTYRLKAHPDITVWLEDGTAAIIDTHQDPAKFTANAKAAFFWEQDYQNRLTFQSLWPEHKAFKPTTFAGQPGTKTFVELTRNDDKRTKDYGYLIAVRGDPNAEKDTPDLMLYVIQDSANAISRGIKPLSKAAFFTMAETIAASVKRREVSAP